MYTPEQIGQLIEGYCETRDKYGTRLLQIGQINLALTSAQAQEYLMQGAGRRYKILHHCLYDVFDIFPPSRLDPLDDEELTRSCVALHAFFLNLFGLLDNLAWTLVHERGLASQIGKFQVGLYAKGTQENLTQEFLQYLNSDTISKWHSEHLKDFRDALAHRIPLYVPPAFDQTGAEIAFPAFTGSLADNKQLILHVQMLADLNTVDEILQKFIAFEFPAVTLLV